MRKPVAITPWLEESELLAWVQEAATVAEHRRRLVIWITHFQQCPARQVAALLGVSVQAVWKWVGEYNSAGPAGLARQGRGGRRWGFLSPAAEAAFLATLHERALAGDLLTAPQVQPLASRAAGRAVSLAYVYRLLHRHQWRKLEPRTHHAKSDRAAREEFKKNSRR